MTLFGPEQVEAGALALRNGHPHDGSDLDYAVDLEVQRLLSAAVAALDRDALVERMNAARCADCHGSGALGGVLAMACGRCHGHGATNADRLAAIGIGGAS